MRNPIDNLGLKIIYWDYSNDVLILLKCYSLIRDVLHGYCRKTSPRQHLRMLQGVFLLQL